MRVKRCDPIPLLANDCVALRRMLMPLVIVSQKIGDAHRWWLLHWISVGINATVDYTHSSCVRLPTKEGRDFYRRAANRTIRYPRRGGTVSFSTAVGCRATVISIFVKIRQETGDKKWFRSFTRKSLRGGWCSLGENLVSIVFARLENICGPKSQRL